MGKGTAMQQMFCQSSGKCREPLWKVSGKYVDTFRCSEVENIQYQFDTSALGFIQLPVQGGEVVLSRRCFNKVPADSTSNSQNSKAAQFLKILACKTGVPRCFE